MDLRTSNSEKQLDIWTREPEYIHKMDMYYLYTLVILALSLKLSNGQASVKDKCKVPTCDGVFLVDGTSAVGAINFQKTKDFLRSMIKRFTISLSGSRIGLVQFTPMARPEFYFKHFSEEARVDQAIGNMPYEPCQNMINCYGSDDLNFSLPYAAELALAEGAGNRPAIPDVIIVVTTGHQNQRSNISALNGFRPLSRRLIYVVDVGDVTQLTMLPGADMIQTFHVQSFDQIGETEEALCVSVRAGVAGLITGEIDLTGNGGRGNDQGRGGTGGGGGGGTGTGNGASNANGSGGGGTIGGTGSNSGSSGGGTGNGGLNGGSGNSNGNNGGSGGGTGGTSGSGSNGNSGGANGGGNSNGNGVTGSGSNGGNGTGSNNGAGGGTGGSNGNSANGGSSSGTAANDSGNGKAGNSNSNSGSNGGSGITVINADGSIIVAGNGNGQGGNGSSQNGTTTAAAVAGAAVGSGTLLGILLLLIGLALIAFFILAYCLYRKRQENKRLMINVQTLRTEKSQAEQAKAQAVVNRQALAKGVQVVRGSTPNGSTSLRNVRLVNGNGENGDYYRVNNDRQRLLAGSEDPNYVGGKAGADFTMRDTRWPEGGPPHGTQWAPPKDSELGPAISGVKLRDATATAGDGEGLEGLELENLQGQSGKDGLGSDQNPNGETVEVVGAMAGDSKRVQGQFRRKRSDDIDLKNRRSSLPSRQSESNLTGTFRRKQYGNGDSRSLEGEEKRASETYSDPVMVNGRYGRKRTHIPVKKFPTPPPALPHVDLLFVVDNSGSIGNANFDRVKAFLRAVAGGIDISAEGSRISCIMFNQEPLLMFGFDKYLSTPYVLGALERLTYMGGGTFSGRALRFAADVFKASTLPPSKKPPLLIGLSPRQQVQAVQAAQAAQTVHHQAAPPPQPSKLYVHPRINVIIFVSDGVTEDHIEEVSENLRSSGVHLAAVSVKGHQQDALLLITRDPKSIFSLDQHAEVSEWIEEKRKGAQVLLVPTLVPGERSVEMVQ